MGQSDPLSRHQGAVNDSDSATLLPHLRRRWSVRYWPVEPHHPQRSRLDLLSQPWPAHVVDETRLHGIIERIGALAIYGQTGKSVSAQIDLHTQNGALPADCYYGIEVSHRSVGPSANSERIALCK